MRFSTDDGRFGIIVTPVGGKGLCRFQLIVGGHVAGDDQPCGVGSALHRLRNPRPLDDARVVQAADPQSLLTTLISDDVLHDAAVLVLAESVDDWLVVGFLRGDAVLILAQAYEARSVLTGPVRWSHVPLPEYSAVVDAADTYWVVSNAQRAYVAQGRG